jgi:hypothetical protein
VSLVYCCEICDARDPHWSLTRRGDVATAWACDDHLAQAAEGLQRDHELTELVIRDSRKAREWAGITRVLNEIAGTDG